MRKSRKYIIFFLILLLTSFCSIAYSELLQNEYVIISYDKKDSKTAQEILERFSGIVGNVNREVGFYKVPIIQLVLAHTKGQFDEYKDAATLPENSVAIAMPSLSKIIIQNPKTLPPNNDFYQILTHEYLHLMLYEVAHNAMIPLWFAEGFVQYFAKQWDLQREITFVTEAIKGNSLNLSLYAFHYPENAHQAQMFYLQSYYTFQYLLKRFGKTRFYEFIENLNKSQSFSVAFYQSFGMDVYEFLTAAKGSISSHSIMALLYSGLGLFWIFIPILLVIAYVRKQRNRRRLERIWEQEELNYFNGGHT